jgi:hypothetical protein
VPGPAVLPQMFIFDCTSCSSGATERGLLAIGNDGTGKLYLPLLQFIILQPFLLQVNGLHCGTLGSLWQAIRRARVATVRRYFALLGHVCTATELVTGCDAKAGRLQTTLPAV